MENGRDMSDSEDDSIINTDDTSSVNSINNNEPDTNATISQRVFFAARDGMALTLYALLADQARPQQVYSKYW